MDEFHVKLAALATKVVAAGMLSGLSWDESVAAFAIASKALANGASKNGDGSMEECCVLAKKRIEQAFGLDVEIMYAGAALARLQGSYSVEDAEAVAEGCKILIVPPKKMAH